MARILGIDYGKKRCGLAITDVLQISINPLPTVSPENILEFLSSNIDLKEVEALAIGWPEHRDGRETYLSEEITKFLSKFAKKYPDIAIHKVDESFTSAEARSIIWQSGTKKKKRRNKELVDQVSAVVIIKRYLESI